MLLFFYGITDTDLWEDIWGILGPLISLLFVLYLLYPEKLEKSLVYIAWFISALSSRIEKYAISKEVEFITGSKFRKIFPSIENIPKIKVEWGEEDKVVLDVERGKLILVLKRGRSKRFDNIAKALILAIPYLLAPEIESVYDKKLTKLISAHIARSLVRDKPSIVEAINVAVSSFVDEDPEARELAGMLVNIDDRSLFTRVLLPEMIEVARMRYPQYDPRLSQELIDFIHVLSALATCDESVKLENPFCRIYFRVMFVLVAKPEKIEMMLMPHVKFVKQSLKECSNIKSIYILAAGRNIVAAKFLCSLLENELRRDHFEVDSIEEHEYRGRYKDAPSMPLYLCRLRLS